MYHVFRENENGKVGIQIKGKLTLDDYELLLTYLKSLKKEVGTISLLFDMTDCEGLNSQAICDDLTRQLQSLQEIFRIAIVGDHLWIAYGTQVFFPFWQTRMKYFMPEQLNEAWSWIEEKP